MILYTTRTKSGILKGFKNEPKYDKYEDRWFCFNPGIGSDFDFGVFMGDLFPEITYGNSPKRVKLSIDIEVDDDIDFDDEKHNFQEIDTCDLQIGDYICIECERFGSDSAYLKIVDIQQRFDAITGEPIIIVTDEEDEIWSTKTGQCLSNPNTFYELIGCYREI